MNCPLSIILHLVQDRKLPNSKRLTAIRWVPPRNSRQDDFSDGRARGRSNCSNWRNTTTVDPSSKTAFNRGFHMANLIRSQERLHADAVLFATSYIHTREVNSTIGITHVFSCINICRVPRKLFEHEAFRPSFQTLSEGPGKC